MDFLSVLSGNALLGLAEICLAVCIFTGFPVPELGVSAFGLSRDDQEGLFELSRLCIRPDIQKEEYNITSWFVSKCIRRFRKDANVRAILRTTLTLLTTLELSTALAISTISG